MYSRDRRTVIVVLVQLLCLAALGVVPAFAEEIGLTWDSNPEPEVAGYVVFVRTATDAPLSFDAGDRTWYAFENAVPGTTYYFRIAAYTNSGVAGPQSNEISVHVPASVVPVPPVSNGFANGSFELGNTGWTAGGSYEVVSGGFWVATNGTRAVVFNAGQRTANGAISQTFTTTPGQTYVAAFDMGAISGLNRNEQRLDVVVKGQGPTPIIAQTLSVTAPGNGTNYVSRSITFRADSPLTTLTFRDTSLTTTNVDLMLDNIRVTATTPAGNEPGGSLVGSALANGSFESHFSGWTRAGSMDVVSGAYWVAADGYSAVAFNVGQQQPTGTLSQTLVTIPGQTYILAFKAGAISSLNRHEQRLQVTVGDVGGTPLLSRTVSVFAPGNGTQYVAQAFTFVATGASATLTFRDVSAETMNVDLLLDDVRVTPAPR